MHSYTNATIYRAGCVALIMFGTGTGLGLIFRILMLESIHANGTKGDPDLCISNVASHLFRNACTHQCHKYDCIFDGGKTRYPGNHNIS